MSRVLNLFSAAVLLSVFIAPALADIAPEPKPEPKPDEKSAAKLPWTAEEVRVKWGKGVSFLMDIETEGAPGWARFEATDIGEKGFKESTIKCEKGRAPSRSKERERTWEKHLGQMGKELAGAEKSEAEVEVPYGKIKCDVYTIKKAEGTQRIALSATVKGMVVMMEMDAKRGDKRDYEKWSLRSIDAPVFDLPWTVEKMAENWKDGATITYSTTSEHGKGIEMYEVTAADINGFTFVTTSTLEGKEPVKGEPRTNTWDKFCHEIMPPRYDSFTSDEKLKTPLGETACIVQKHIEESGGNKVTITVWLAKDEPGLLVKLEMMLEEGEKKTVNTVELTEYKKGKK